MGKKEETHWKTIAIVFIVLFIVETVCVIALMAWGFQITAQEDYCSLNVCASDEYVSYYYETYDNTCYCYDSEGEVAKTEKLT